MHLCVQCWVEILKLSGALLHYVWLDYLLFLPSSDFKPGFKLTKGIV